MIIPPAAGQGARLLLPRVPCSAAHWDLCVQLPRPAPQATFSGSVPEPDSEVAPPEDDVPSPAHVWRSVFFAVRTLRFHWHLGLRRAQRP
eukprot:g32131.t1